MKPIRLVVVASTTRPGMLSMRAKKGDKTATPIYAALTDSGAKVGDVLELRRAPKRRARGGAVHGEIDMAEMEKHANRIIK